ncbi:MAG: hypothetical protein JXR56_08855 [Candidatus Cloacimonetes bacterium]|nr:hypothetical protein [Candidatus Cloacimonadota bacterium]
MKSLSDTFTVSKGRPVWDSKFNTRFEELLKVNESKSFEIKVESIRDKAEHWQFKFYWGHLLPAIADECYSKVVLRAHYEMKKLYLNYSISSWSEIPEKHKSRIIPILRVITDSITGEMTEDICGYIRSTSTLSKDEFQEYIHKIQGLIIDMGIQVSFSEEAMEMYRRGCAA